ncbi:hypothetical protein QCD60_29920 [Pokkaliibacter sp. MBI-7]|uniref:hypothetical protein n=1 Tax=Pokkaliibacter sp. MBI-7 TaxID=3040600 RepID=UPI0024482DFE|nr:hypothetical protein [Pokkaliibacter sp. MBI-7]MDH2431038.1 hypothetical protein [Pokkaliibacter sp. MBI-7]MDH2436733.1 hypothetical protein [Pokkaliibacter sp. MBI-7]
MQHDMKRANLFVMVPMMLLAWISADSYVDYRRGKEVAEFYGEGHYSLLIAPIPVGNMMGVKVVPDLEGRCEPNPQVEMIPFKHDGDSVTVLCGQWPHSHQLQLGYVPKALIQHGL